MAYYDYFISEHDLTAAIRQGLKELGNRVVLEDGAIYESTQIVYGFNSAVRRAFRNKVEAHTIYIKPSDFDDQTQTWPGGLVYGLKFCVGMDEVLFKCKYLGSPMVKLPSRLSY